ncbi:hypothetical protein CHS0354_029311, partial [Potamilus streckersoni]
MSLMEKLKYNTVETDVKQTVVTNVKQIDETDVNVSDTDVKDKVTAVMSWNTKNYGTTTTDRYN